MISTSSSPLIRRILILFTPYLISGYSYPAALQNAHQPSDALGLKSYLVLTTFIAPALVFMIRATIRPGEDLYK